jgi:hypothetical protein
MESMAVAPGFARAIAGTGPVFAAFLVPHTLAGLTAISRKGTERHVRAGTAYFGAITVLAATAAGLTAIRVPAAAGGGCLRHRDAVLRGQPLPASPGHSALVSA